MKENNSYQEKAAEILFQINKKVNLDRLNKSVSYNSSLEKKKLTLPKNSNLANQKKIDLFFSNPKNVAQLEKQFDKNLKGILEYLLERKRAKRKSSK